MSPQITEMLSRYCATRSWATLSSGRPSGRHADDRTVIDSLLNPNRSVSIDTITDPTNGTS